MMEDSVVPLYKAILTSAVLFLFAANAELAISPTALTPPPGPSTRQIAIPAVKRDFLLNELQLMVLPQPGTGVVTAHLRINSGAMFDLAGKGGLADITAGMLLRSAKGLPAKDLSDYLTQLGLTLSVKVGWDSTDIAISGPATGLESIFDLFGRLVIKPSFGQPELDALKSARVAELSAETSSPIQLARETAVEALYGRYPLGRPVHGTIDSIAKIGTNDVAYYHNRFYIANDAELAIEGDVLAEEVTLIARSKLGIWKKGEKVPATFLPPEPLTARRIMVLDRPESPNAAIVSAGHSISRRSIDYLASTVMAQVLESSVARTNSGARVKLEARYLPGPMLVALDSPSDKTAAAVQAVLDAMERLRSADIPQEDLDRAKQSVISSFAQETATSDGQVGALLDIEQYGLGRDYLINFAARVAAVSAAEVKQAAQTHLDPRALAISVVGPAASLSEPLKKLGQVKVVGGRHTF
jgi:zinc protease